MGWTGFILAFVAFFISHSVPVRAPVKPWLVARFGQRGFTVAYSILSLAVLAWLISEASSAPYVMLWSPAPWQNHVPLVAMAVVCAVAALALGRPNPFSFGGPSDADFDPENPGIVRFIRHPLLVALALWSLAHLVPNGDVAHVILFGTFAGFALLGMPLLDRRKRRQMGPRWDSLLAQVRAAPPVRMPSVGTWLRLVAAALLYLALLAVHPVLFGVSPLP